MMIDVCYGLRKLPSWGTISGFAGDLRVTGTGSHSNLAGNSTLRLIATRHFTSAVQLSPQFPGIACRHSPQSDSAALN
jgi:hypothetical protein